MSVAQRTGNLVVISAPSGSGKTTLVHRVLKELDDTIFSVSYTTRPPRPGELHGRDYFFVDEATFRNMLDEGEFYEWATYLGYLYGTSRTFAESETAAGRDVLLEIEVQGGMQVKAANPDALLVFVLPPSARVQEQRLRARGAGGDDDIRRRLRQAREEIRCVAEYQYAVVNEDVEAAVREIVTIIRAARCRTVNNRSRIREIVQTFDEVNHD
jgi:guanylate kinase